MAASKRREINGRVHLNVPAIKPERRARGVLLRFHRKTEPAELGSRAAAFAGEFGRLEFRKRLGCRPRKTLSHFLALDREQVEPLDLGQSRLRCTLRKNEGIQRKLHSSLLQFIRRHLPLENGFPERSEPLPFELLRKKPYPHGG